MRTPPANEQFTQAILTANGTFPNFGFGETEPAKRPFTDLKKPHAEGGNSARLRRSPAYLDSPEAVIRPGSALYQTTEKRTVGHRPFEDEMDSGQGAAAGYGCPAASHLTVLRWRPDLRSMSMLSAPTHQRIDVGLQSTCHCPFQRPSMRQSIAHLANVMSAIT